jgi:hypothetical protein
MYSFVGWLDSKSHARQPWKRFWFELAIATGELSYFKSNSACANNKRSEEV